MTVTRLHPADIGKPNVSNYDDILAALNHAVEDHKTDGQLGQSARGVIIVWLRDYPDGSFGESFIVGGAMNAVEAVGLLTITADDIGHDGLSGPDHFPDGRPPPEDEPA